VIFVIVERERERERVCVCVWCVCVCVCETWSLTLRDERRLRVFKSRVLRIIFGSRRDEVTTQLGAS